MRLDSAYCCVLNHPISELDGYMKSVGTSIRLDFFADVPLSSLPDNSLLRAAFFAAFALISSSALLMNSCSPVFSSLVHSPLWNFSTPSRKSSSLSRSEQIRCWLRWVDVYKKLFGNLYSGLHFHNSSISYPCMWVVRHGSKACFRGSSN